MIKHLIKIHQNLGGLDSPVIHIAGSKGKGTTAELLAKILQMAGKKVGLFTSPALFSMEEMIRVNGETIGANSLKEKVLEIHGLYKNLSEFEVLALAGLEYFQEEKCDYVVLECGWGGSRDATNVVQNKVLTLLSHIELEHMEILGQNIPEITREKLGICREGVPLITVASQVSEVFEEIDAAGISPVMAPALEIGPHHPESCGLAIAAAEQLGITVTPKMYTTLEELVIPGRFEVAHSGQHTLILDGAHTYDSIQYIREKVLHFAQENGYPLPFWCIHFLSDKRKDLWTLFPTTKTIWVDLDHPRAGRRPQALPDAEIAEIFQQLQAEEMPKLLVFIGSFRLVAAVKAYLRSQARS